MKIEKNFHGHTFRCKHAYGSEREYIEKAIEAGYKTFGFSDHTPQPFHDGFVSRIRMDMEELDGYIETLYKLKLEYSKKIEVLTGLEVEYYPALFDELIKEIKKRPVDYLILGQHFVPDERDGFYSGSATDDEGRLKSYVDLTIKALETGLFFYLAHPDLIYFTGDDKIYEKHMSRLCEYCISKNIPLEINMYGYLDKRNYPCDKFFGMASKMGCSFVIGLDCHFPEHILQPEDVPGFNSFLKRNKIGPASIRYNI